MSTNKPEWISEELYKHICSLLSNTAFVPTLTLNALMDEVFKDDEWWDFEYETILETFQRYGFPLPSVYLLGQIQCIGAIRNNESFIDKEWHIFEKATLALTGVPVLFFEKQNIPIEAIYHAAKLMRRLGDIEFSEEVKHYIGCEAINEEIMWHPIPFIDTEIVNSLNRLKSMIGLSDDEISILRKAAKDKFNSMIDTDLETAEFDQNKPEDIMCMAVLKSILISKDMEQEESNSISKFLSIKDGSEFHEEIPEDVPEVKAVNTEASNVDDDSYNPNIELIEDREVEVLTFGDGIREGELENNEKLAELFKESSSLPGVPIDTGVAMTGQEDDSKGPSHDLESTGPLHGDAEEKMVEFKNKSVNENEGESSHEVVDPSIAFEL